MLVRLASKAWLVTGASVFSIPLLALGLDARYGVELEELRSSGGLVHSL